VVFPETFEADAWANAWLYLHRLWALLPLKGSVRTVQLAYFQVKRFLAVLRCLCLAQGTVAPRHTARHSPLYGLQLGWGPRDQQKSEHARRLSKQQLQVQSSATTAAKGHKSKGRLRKMQRADNFRDMRWQPLMPLSQKLQASIKNAKSMQKLFFGIKGFHGTIKNYKKGRIH